MAALPLEKKTGKRRHSPQSAGAVGPRAPKTTKRAEEETEVSAAATGLMQIEHPELLRLQGMRKAREAARKGEQSQERIQRLAAASGLDAAALLEPGPWYCANPFNRTCTKNAEHGLESKGAFGSVEDCFSACQVPPELHALVAQYAPRRLTGVGRSIVAHLSQHPLAEQQLPEMDLPHFFSQLVQDSKWIDAAVMALGKGLIDAKQAESLWDNVRRAIAEGRGFLAAAPALTYAAALPDDSTWNRLIEIIKQTPPQSAWPQWIARGAFVSPSAVHVLSRAILAQWPSRNRAGAAWTRAHVGPMQHLAILSTYVPPHDWALQRSLDLGFVDSLVDLPRLDLPTLELYVRIYGCNMVRTLATMFSPAALAEAKSMKNAERYTLLHTAAGVAALIARDAFRCGISPADISWIPQPEARRADAVTVHKDALENLFRGPMRTDDPTALEPEYRVTLPFTEALYRIVASLRQAVQGDGPPDPAVVDAMPWRRCAELSKSLNTFVSDAMQRASTPGADPYQELRRAQSIAQSAMFAMHFCKLNKALVQFALEPELATYWMPASARERTPLAIRDVWVPKDVVDDWVNVFYRLPRVPPTVTSRNQLQLVPFAAAVRQITDSLRRMLPDPPSSSSSSEEEADSDDEDEQGSENEDEGALAREDEAASENED